MELGEDTPVRRQGLCVAWLRGGTGYLRHQGRQYRCLLDEAQTTHRRPRSLRLHVLRMHVYISQAQSPLLLLWSLNSKGAVVVDADRAVESRAAVHLTGQL